MKNYEGLQIITINNGYTSLYSGMTPGLIENYYVLEDASINLVFSLTKFKALSKSK